MSDREILDKYIDLDKILSVRFRKETSYEHYINIKKHLVKR